MSKYIIYGKQLPSEVKNNKTFTNFLVLSDFKEHDIIKIRQSNPKLGLQTKVIDALTLKMSNKKEYQSLRDYNQQSIPEQTITINKPNVIVLYAFNNGEPITNMIILEGKLNLNKYNLVDSILVEPETSKILEIPKHVTIEIGKLSELKSL